MDQRTATGVVATAQSKLVLFEDPTVCAATAVSDFRGEDLIEGPEPLAVYLTVAPAASSPRTRSAACRKAKPSSSSPAAPRSAASASPTGKTASWRTERRWRRCSPAASSARARRGRQPDDAAELEPVCVHDRNPHARTDPGQRSRVGMTTQEDLPVVAQRHLDEHAHPK